MKRDRMKSEQEQKERIEADESQNEDVGITEKRTGKKASHTIRNMSNRDSIADKHMGMGVRTSLGSASQVSRPRKRSSSASSAKVSDSASGKKAAAIRRGAR